jgi:coenzyme PQQ precursor peptide PqqA
MFVLPRSRHRSLGLVHRPSKDDEEIVNITISTGETTMTWSTPEFVDIRFGFEVTMYIYHV